MIDPWAAGYSGPEDDPARAGSSRPLTWLRSEPGEHGYARPIEGLVVVVDLDAMEVIEVADHGVVALPPKAGNYDPERMADAGQRPVVRERRAADLKPIEITQPEGASFTVSGHGVAWQKWHVRVGFTPREGLVLHELCYDERPIVYRASLAEMYVPYGDPAPTHRFKNVFDQGEYGVGWLANPLTLGCDCVGEIHYFDGVVNDQDGEPMVIPNAVCMHEEDYGIGWKHTDFRTEEVEVRRLRRLVISLDRHRGQLRVRVLLVPLHRRHDRVRGQAHGRDLDRRASSPATRPKHGTLVAPGLYGPHHQHFFCVRLDMAVDGNENTVVHGRLRAAAVGPGEPDRDGVGDQAHGAGERGAGARARSTRCKGRFWRIENPNKVSALGDPVAYKLVPGENVAPMYAPDSPLRQARRASRRSTCG